MSIFPLASVGRLILLSIFWVLMQPINVVALPLLKQYITLNNALDDGKYIYPIQPLQRHVQLDALSDKHVAFWLNLYDRSENSKLLGGNLQFSSSLTWWASIHGSLGGLSARVNKKIPIQLEKIFSQLNIIIGDIKQYPFHFQIGLLDMPFGLHASHILPPELMYTQQMCRSVGKKIGCNVILASQPLVDQTLVNIFLLSTIPSLTKKRYHTLSGGVSIYCPLNLHGWLKCNLGGGFYIRNNNYQPRWDIYAEAISGFWRMYVERTQLQNDYFADHIESSIHVSILKHPITLVALLARGQFGRDVMHNNMIVGCKIPVRRYLNTVIGAKLDSNQLIYKLQGKPDAWNKLTNFIFRVEFVQH